MPAAPRRLAWSNLWVRVAAAVGMWLAAAVFFIVITPKDLRASDQAFVMVAWGVVGAAFAALWHVIQKPIGDMLIARMPSRRARGAVAFAAYMAFFIVMMVMLAALDVGQGGGWWGMGTLAFLCAGAIPAEPWVRVVARSGATD